MLSTPRIANEPAPDRKRTTTWSTFLKAHWDQLGAIDFTTVEVWTKSGLVTFYLLFAMRLATRQVRFLGCTPNPVSSWMAQMARNLTDAFDGLLRAPVRYVLLDRDAKFTAEFQAMLIAAGVKPVLLPPQSPNCNAHLERFLMQMVGTGFWPASAHENWVDRAAFRRAEAERQRSALKVRGTSIQRRRSSAENGPI